MSELRQVKSLPRDPKSDVFADRLQAGVRRQHPHPFGSHRASFTAQSRSRAVFF
jgi:hypothetical protein